MWVEKYLGLNPGFVSSQSEGTRQQEGQGGVGEMSVQSVVGSASVRELPEYLREMLQDLSSGGWVTIDDFTQDA